MKRTLVKLRNSAFRKFVVKHQKYAPLIFFVGGFIFDTLTLGRIDRLYDLIILCLYMTLLTVMLYIFNRADDGRWNNTFLEPYIDYVPLAIQFFFGGLASAYVIYFSRSVSLSKTLTFFLILLALLLANEILKKRISNKYLQFSVYFFVNFTFFTFMTPVFLKEMNPNVFLFSGFISLVISLVLIIFIYKKSPSTRAEIRISKIIGIIFLMYTAINLFYFFKLIPPVPLALDTGIVAHNISVEDNNYVVTYETDDWYVFWRDHRIKFIYNPGQEVYVFTSIFAPTDIEKTIAHRWKWYDEALGEWEIVDDIAYDITGGRDAGYRGYTFKTNVKEGLWKVEVITEEELILGVIDFEIIVNANKQPRRVVVRKF